MQWSLRRRRAPAHLTSPNLMRRARWSAIVVVRRRTRFRNVLATVLSSLSPRARALRNFDLDDSGVDVESLMDDGQGESWGSCRWSQKGAQRRNPRKRELPRAPSSAPAPWNTPPPDHHDQLSSVSSERTRTSHSPERVKKASASRWTPREPQ